MSRQWFEVQGLRIVLCARASMLANAGLTLLDAINAKNELAECVDELVKKLDVRHPSDRTEPK